MITKKGKKRFQVLVLLLAAVVMLALVVIRYFSGSDSRVDDEASYWGFLIIIFCLGLAGFVELLFVVEERKT
jgi:hypothetical protein